MIRLRFWLSIALMTSGLAVSAVSAWQWRQGVVEESRLATLQRGGAPPADADPRLRLAWANHLLRRQRYDDALEIFSALLEEAPRELLPWVHYNLGNLYLRQAKRQVEQSAFDEAIPLVALAKQSYRQALRLQPDLWAARYNLEAAIRLLPEIEPFPLKSKESGEAAPKALWTRVPGFPRGLP